jgi:hypothetical protein
MNVAAVVVGGAVIGLAIFGAYYIYGLLEQLEEAKRRREDEESS